MIEGLFLYTFHHVSALEYFFASISVFSLKSTVLIESVPLFPLLCHLLHELAFTLLILCRIYCRVICPVRSSTRILHCFQPSLLKKWTYLSVGPSRHSWLVPYHIFPRLPIQSVGSLVLLNVVMPRWPHCGHLVFFNSAVNFSIQSSTSSDFIPLATRAIIATQRSLQIIIYSFASLFLSQLVTQSSITAILFERL